MRLQGYRLGFLAVLGYLAACSSTPGQSGDAYWHDKNWDGQLLHTLQSAIHYPMDAAGNPIGQPVSVRGKIKFLYSAGKILYPQMIESTGRPDLDAAMLQQVSATQVPAASGPQAHEPHAFSMELSMPSPLDVLMRSIYDAISAQRIYPKEAIIHGDQGSSVIGFDYDGDKASNVAVFKSSKVLSLDGASMRAVARAQLPQRPTWAPMHPLHLQISICYSLGNNAACPLTQHVIEIVDSPGVTQPASPSSGP